MKGSYFGRIAFIICFTLSGIIATINVYAKASSDSLLGTPGYNTVPSARMDEPGTLKAGVATLDPYLHGFIGFQLAAPLYIQLRQSAETSHLKEDPDRLYPGVDAKLRLLTETRLRPEITIGLQSAIGHKRMGGEYLALSKRWGDFDVTGGIGWGRFGTAGKLPNPLKGISSHFGETRALDGEDPQGLSDWFTGSDVGLFAGVDYALPLKGLSLKLDYGSDSYSVERALSDFNPPARWSAGLAYRPFDFLDIGLAAQGKDKIMGRVTLKAQAKDWFDPDKRIMQPLHLRNKRAQNVDTKAMEIEAQGADIPLVGVELHGATAQGSVHLQTGLSTPRQMGRAAIPVMNHGGADVEEIALQPVLMNLHGPRLKIMRADLERAYQTHHGSTSEIWKNMTIAPAKGISWLPPMHDPRVEDLAFDVALETHTSLSEEDSGILYRTALLAGISSPLGPYLENMVRLRLNTKNNLEQLEEIRVRPFLPVRSDIDLFAARGFALDRAQTSFTHSFNSNLHLALSSGYLEEMYGGLGGEILFRPYDSRFAAGVELWQAFKRDPYSFMNLGFNGDHLLTGHIKAWYDLPAYDLTLQLRAGRYLAEDIGGSIGIEKIWPSGVRLAAQSTITDAADFDPFGARTHAAHEIRLTLPLGHFSALPASSRIESRFGPIGRDAGQSLENPLPLYALTEAFSARHLEENWGDVLDLKEE